MSHIVAELESVLAPDASNRRKRKLLRGQRREQAKKCLRSMAVILAQDERAIRQAERLQKSPFLVVGSAQSNEGRRWAAVMTQLQAQLDATA